MTRTRLEEDAIRSFLDAHPAWRVEGGSLEREYTFGTYSEGIAFAVQIGMLAEKRDHHPDLVIGYRVVTVRWVTHDAGGLTDLDRLLAHLCDEIAALYVRSTKAGS